MMKWPLIALTVVMAASSAGESFAGDCVAAKEKFNTAETVQHLHEALVMAHDVKAADAVVAEHGDSLSELKEIARDALDLCKQQS